MPKVLQTCDNSNSNFVLSSEAIATDIDAFLEKLNPSLFPGISSSIEVHSGFANEQAKYDLFAACSGSMLILCITAGPQRTSCPLSRLLSRNMVRIRSRWSDIHLVCSGLSNRFLLTESIGAAIALLDSVYLPLHLSGVTFQTVTYGLPRVS